MGGGYDLYRVVPRAWSLVWAEMAQLSLPTPLPSAWKDRWQAVWEATQGRESAPEKRKAPKSQHFPTTFEDLQEDVPPQPRRDEIYRKNRVTAAMVRQFVLSPLARQAFPTSFGHSRSPLAGLFDFLHPDGCETPSRSRSIKTPRGGIFLRDCCPVSLVERLRVEEGLHAFARLPEREHQLLLSIAKNPDCALTLAHTPTGEIIGQVTLAPLDEWWEELESAYEIAIEVSTNWRSMGIAQQLLAFALDLDTLEDMLLCAIGLSWHWDFEGLDISPRRYRQMLAHLFSAQDFIEFDTTEPNIMMEPTNVLFVRVGKRVDSRQVEQFRHVIQRSPALRM